MIAAQQIQERRLDELLKCQLGTRILTAIGDPQITQIIVNEDGRVWFESYGKGMQESGCPPVGIASGESDRNRGGITGHRSEHRQSDPSRPYCPSTAFASRACFPRLPANHAASCASPPRCFTRSTTTSAMGSRGDPCASFARSDRSAPEHRRRRRHW